MRSEATGRQLQILQAIRVLTEMYQHPPTLHELSAWMKMAAPGGAASAVKALVKKELLRTSINKARSMVITELGAAALARFERE